MGRTQLHAARMLVAALNKRDPIRCRIGCKPLGAIEADSIVRHCEMHMRKLIGGVKLEFVPKGIFASASE